MQNVSEDNVVKGVNETIIGEKIYQGFVGICRMWAFMSG